MTRVVTPEHKEAMKRGRQASAAVDAYLNAIDQPKRRGRKVSVDDLRRRRTQAEAEAQTGSGAARLKALQSVRDLDARIAAEEASDSVDIDALQAAFVSVAAEYGESHGIEYPTWRSAGVPAEVLKAAGIKQTRQRS